MQWRRQTMYPGENKNERQFYNNNKIPKRDKTKFNDLKLKRAMEGNIEI